MPPKRLIYNDYYDALKVLINEYGSDSTVFMQVGDFFELYAENTEGLEYTSIMIKRIAQICDFQITRKDKKKPLCHGNPQMIGFPIRCKDKYLEILVTQNNFNVRVIEQVTPSPNPKREITGTFSPGTMLSSSKTTNNLMSVYIEHCRSFSNSNNSTIYIGISVIDLSIGNNSVLEAYSKKDDKNYPLYELYRAIQCHNPVEIIITYDHLPNKMNQAEFIQFLEIESKRIQWSHTQNINPEFKKKSFQNYFLKTIFPNTGLLSVVEFLDLEKREFGLVSYVILLNFAHKHNESIISKINTPIIWQENKYLVLTHNSIHQLDLISRDDSKNKFSSLFGIIDNTSTAPGRRLLKERLLNPIKNPDTLRNRYQYIGECLQTIAHKYRYIQLEDHLSNIQDLERIHRRLSLGRLEPHQFANIDIAYSKVLLLIDYINTDCHSIKDILPSIQCIHKFKQFISEYQADFDLEEMEVYNLDNITSSFFNIGREPIIDKIQADLNDCFIFMNTLKDKLSSFIKNKSKQTPNDCFVKLKKTEKKGYYLAVTNKRANILKECLKNISNHSIKIKVNDSKTVKVRPNNLCFSAKTKNETVIKSRSIDKHVMRILSLTETIKYEAKNAFLRKMIEYDGKYNSTLKEIVHFISEVDVIKSCAKTAIKNHYFAPQIKDQGDQTSFIDAKELRHPIIEKIQQDIEYVPNDINIGGKHKGILLYGTNASGKSSLMKSIGLNIIMAQAGMYVAAKEFTFCPYDYLFTRIRNTDNLFKGQSSFAVEISELRDILKRANNKSLVLGDELCSGTESYSALSIFSASVYKLSHLDVNFIFATHLHGLVELDEIKNLTNLKISHLKVEYNEEQDKLIYDRKLVDGSGPTTYGLEVCRAMDLDRGVLEMANNIRKRLLNQSVKTSKYNSDLYVSRCEICKSTTQLEVHHIKFQCSADINKFIGHIHKDKKSNLVPLCNSCHNAVHNKDLEIFGYKQTSHGIELDFKTISPEEMSAKKQTRKKYSKTQISTILTLKEHPNLTQKMACYKLKKKYDIQISSATLSKIWNGTY